MVSPLADYGLGFFQAVEDFAIEQFVPQFSIEGFAVSVFPRAARFDVKSFSTNLGQPAAHDFRGHLRAVVRTDVFRDATDQHHIGHGLQHTEAVDPASNPDRQALSRELIDQCHQPNFAAVVGLSLNKIVGPDMIAPLRS